MKLPQLLPECGYTHFCGPCRDKEAGRSFRQSILQIRGVECDVDFECPKGKVWGEQTAPASAPKPAKRKSRGVGDTIAKVTGFGDIFHGIVASKYGIPACQKCQEVIHEMNELGVDGCVREKSRIIDGLWSRRDQLKGWKRVIAKLPGSEHLAKAELSRLFDQATSQTKQTDSL